MAFQLNRKWRVLALAVVSAMPAVSWASDNVVLIVPKTAATGGTKSIGAFGYRPDTDGAGPNTEEIWVTAYGSGALQTTNPTITRVTGISLGQTPTATTMVSEAQSRYFYTDGNPNYALGSGNQGSSSFTFNPVQIGSFAPFSTAWTVEGVNVLAGPSQTATPSSNDRFTRYSLNQVTSNPDALVQLTSLANLSDFQTAVGAASTVTQMNWLRQSVWSSNGQSLYHSDSGTPFGGIWKLNPLTGGVQRIVTSTRAATLTEMVAIAQPSGADRILFVGKSGDANAGGINYVDYNGAVLTSDSDVKTFMTAGTLKEFFDGAVAGRTDSPNVWSMTYNAATKTIYAQDQGTKTLFAIDELGRMHKVTTRDEAAVTLPTVGASWLRLQNRQTLTAGGFLATQVMFTDNGTDGVVGAFDYKVGDFNRDDDVTSADKAMFLGALQPRKTYTSGTLPAAGANSKYDLNGNRTIDWKDVKILQTFLGFKNGDANLDGSVDMADLAIVAANYYLVDSSGNKTWALGDFASLDPNATIYAPNAADANLVNAVDIQVLGANWSLPLLTYEQIDALGYTGELRDNVIIALVPEPASAALIVSAGAALLARRRRRKGCGDAHT